MTDWHLAPSLVALQKELDSEFPGRPKDGTIGDAAHAARPSEHNPDNDPDPMPKGAVSAMDIYTSKIDKVRVLDKLKKDSRTWYVIHAGYIYSRKNNFAKVKYEGSNPHTSHIHLSLNQTKAAHDSKASWGIADAAPTPPKPVDPQNPPAVKYVKLESGVKPGRRHAQVKLLQQFLVRAGYGPIRGAFTTYYGENTENAVNRFHKANKHLSNGKPFDGAIGPRGFEELQKEVDSK